MFLCLPTQRSLLHEFRCIDGCFLFLRSRCEICLRARFGNMVQAAVRRQAAPPALRRRRRRNCSVGRAAAAWNAGRGQQPLPPTPHTSRARSPSRRRVAKKCLRNSEGARPKGPVPLEAVPRGLAQGSSTAERASLLSHLVHAANFALLEHGQLPLEALQLQVGGARAPVARRWAQGRRRRDTRALP